MRISYGKNKVKNIPKRYKDIGKIEQFFSSDKVNLTTSERHNLEQQFLLDKFIVLFKDWEDFLTVHQKNILIRPKVNNMSYVAQVKTREKIYWVIRFEGNPEIECMEKVYNAAKKVEKITTRVITRVY